MIFTDCLLFIIFHSIFVYSKKANNQDKYKEMQKVIIEEGVVHVVPEDIKAVLVANEALLDKWNSLTPLMRNEWICWTTIVKQESTRKEHIRRLEEDILEERKGPVAGRDARTEERVPGNGLTKCNYENNAFFGPTSHSPVLLIAEYSTTLINLIGCRHTIQRKGFKFLHHLKLAEFCEKSSETIYFLIR